MSDAAKLSGARAALQNLSHRRFNPLLKEWVLVSPRRTQRPWLGKVEDIAATEQPAYDPSCYLCPGNVRAGGARNPHYSSVFSFENDFPALLPDVPEIDLDSGPLLEARSERGVCQVVCFSPRHDQAISRMSSAEVRAVVDELIARSSSLASVPWVSYVQIFENRGELMGASNPHPHCQIWASASVPNVPARESASLSEYRNAHGSCLLCDYLEVELNLQERILWQNDAFVVLVPFWAVWPFETLLISRRHASALDGLSVEERSFLGAILGRTASAYDNLFGVPFPYSMGFHSQPTDGNPHTEWHLHAHYFPPLLRSATVRKFMVGFEMLGTPQRDLTPEYAAAQLRRAARI